MTIRLLRKQTSKHPSNALFPQEQNTRIAPTQINNQRNRTRFNCWNGGDCQLGQRESWSGDTFGVWNFHHKNNVYCAVFAGPFTQSHYCLSFTCQLCSVTHCRNGCMRKCGCFFFKLQESRTDIMIYVSQWWEEICFILETMNFNAVSD